MLRLTRNLLRLCLQPANRNLRPGGGKPPPVVRASDSHERSKDQSIGVEEPGGSEFESGAECGFAREENGEDASV